MNSSSWRTLLTWLNSSPWWNLSSNMRNWLLLFDEIWLSLTIHQLDETFIDSKYPDFVKLCPYLTTEFLTMMKFITLAKIIILMKFITLMMYIFSMKYITLMKAIKLLKHRLLMKSTTLFYIKHICYIFQHDEINQG